jgi:hypothetical protein
MGILSTPATDLVFSRLKSFQMSNVERIVRTLNDRKIGRIALLISGPNGFRWQSTTDLITFSEGLFFPANTRRVCATLMGDTDGDAPRVHGGAKADWKQTLLSSPSKRIALRLCHAECSVNPQSQAPFRTRSSSDEARPAKRRRQSSASSRACCVVCS